MAVLWVTTEIDAPIERVFDLARDVKLHERSMRRYGEQAVAGTTSGLLALGDDVTWRARHFGRSRTLTSQIVAFDAPRHFRDSMTRGPFARLDHDHRFESRGGRTVMSDVFDYALPLGPLGAIADRLFVRRRLRRLLEERAEAVKEAAERPPTGR